LKIAQENGDRINEGLWLGHIGMLTAYWEIWKKLLIVMKSFEIAQEIGDRRNEGLWVGKLRYGISYDRN